MRLHDPSRCEHEIAADYQHVPWSTSFKFTAPASVFESARILRAKKMSFELNLTSWTCCQRQKNSWLSAFAIFHKLQTYRGCQCFGATRILRGKTHSDFWMKSCIVDINKISKSLLYLSRMQFLHLHGACYHMNGDVTARTKKNPHSSRFFL